jgi:hypothetical protein
MPFVIGEVEVVNEVSLAPSAVLYDGAVVADGDLTVKVNSFFYEIAGVHGKYIGSVANVVTDNQTNYVYLNALAALAINTTGYPTSAHIRLARVVTQSGIIVRVILERAFFTGGGSMLASTVKAGVALAASFSGSPKKSTVTFASPYGSTAYAVIFSPITDGSRTFSPSAETKTVSGFTVNLNNNNLAGLLEIDWHTTQSGE